LQLVAGVFNDLLQEHFPDQSAQLLPECTHSQLPSRC
jgi:hypothetical protein